MDMGIASDLSNRNFSGAVNPDSLLAVEFYWHEPEDVHKSEAAGKIIKLPKTPYVRISNPGDKTSVIETPVREEHKRRWPERWMYWQMKEGLVDSADVPGWKLEDWTHVNAEQVRDLKYLRFSVVEQVAGASDEQVQKIGMGGLALREAARQALRARMGAEVKEEMQKKDAEIAALRAADAEKEARLARLEALLTAPKPEIRVRESVQKIAEADAAILDAHFPKAEMVQDPIPVSERDFLAARYLAKFGKKPHHKAGVEKIRKDLGE